ncbi:hypothetical protein N9J02_00055 [bacterium]|jgi:hypothetical protein|nr:hypothetical protein [bacterium]|tara:strand:- start:686 stop:862 length:177 start_codon:yes stop_codon:yes gene_type:complete
MKIDINTTDDDGIHSSVTFDSDFEYEEDFRDFTVLIFKLLMKNGVELPEELVEELEKL